MSVISTCGRDPASEARALLNCVLRDGDVVGTDDAGRTALLLLIDPWTLDRLLAFDANAAELEDADSEPEPDDEVDGPPTVVDFAPPKRGGRASHVAQALTLALPARDGAAGQGPRRSGAGGSAAPHVDRTGAGAVLPDLPEGSAVR